MTMPDHYYGIDLGGTKIELVACDASLQVRYRQRVATPTQDYEALVRALVSLVRGADDALGTSAPAIGIGVPGIIDAASGTHLCANIPCLTGRELLPVLRAQLQRPIALGNDCQCFALSEAHGGAADGAASMFGLILGTGAGAGYVIDQKLVRGLHGAAGEWGHWPLDPHLLQRYELPLLPCPCGRVACLESYVSGTGLRRLHAHLTGGEGVSAEQLAARHNAGDNEAASVFKLHLDLLGAALARIVLAYDPHVVVLGGGLSQLPHLYTGLADAIRPHLIPGLGVPPILPPVFGDAGGARGAALLARQATITQEP
ncbi:N-acetylglucosamine kinase [Duganella sp. CF402]|uniref:ROK family protein n=1 Tax=unclassified Duganella TaxID=2636909 RepID=UPI0008B3D954|nr:MULTISPECIES: ROK family protein [unclassified Duganella]RZT11315.1 N-acetylglucosamine kinase [Duganella sp. BK701]SEK70798.1 N-acetylglucosamine kinase [Duganella sp. CF402]